MNDGLTKIKGQVNDTLKWLLKDLNKASIAYLLYHIRNGVYVPIEVSDPSIFDSTDYYLAFSRLKKDDFPHEPQVVPLEGKVPILLQRGRIESLYFQDRELTSFWQELIPVTSDNRMVLVRSSCCEFRPLSKEAREALLHSSGHTHSEWERMGDDFFSSFLAKDTAMATCQDVIDCLAQQLADAHPFPPFYDIIHFQVTAQSAHESAKRSVTRCNPLSFNTGILLDFVHDKWPWIPDMPLKCANGENHFSEYIPEKYPHALPEDAFHRSIVEQTKDLVVKVCEQTDDEGSWQFFARHNRLGSHVLDEKAMYAAKPSLVTKNPFSAVAKILSDRPIEHDYLVTLWAVNARDYKESHPVGSRVTPLLLPKFRSFTDDHKYKVCAGDSKSVETVLITFQPASGCSAESLTLLEKNLKKAADDTLKKIQMLAPAERLKAIYRSILDPSLNWNRHFADKTDKNGGGLRLLHDVVNFKANATDEEWRELGTSVTTALNRLDSSVILWPCLKQYDPAWNFIYACIGKSFAQKSICPELATCFAGGVPQIYETEGYWLLQDSDRSKTAEGAAELAAGLILLGQNLRLAFADRSPTMFPKQETSNRVGRFKLVFEGKDCPLEKIQEFARCCFNELPNDEFGKKHWVQTAAQLIRPFTRSFMSGFVERDGKMRAAIYLEFKLTDKP